MTTVLVQLARSRRLALSGLGREIREAAGISAREMAVELDVDVATLTRWERGECRPRRAAAIRWEEALAALAVEAEA